jgi:hypothetical protein
MGLTKAQLDALNDSSFPNNNGGLITPQVLRDYNDAIIVNTVNQDVYTADSASFNTRILAVTGSSIATGSFATTGSNTFIGNQIISGNVFPQVDGQGDIGSDTFKWNKIVVNGELKGSSLNTSGRSRCGTMGFVDETFPLTNLDSREIIGDGSGVNTHMYYATSSTDVNGLREFVYAQSGSDANFTNVSASFNTRILAVTGSSINTGSFATTGSNTFTGIQNFTADITSSANVLINGDLTVNPNTSTKLNGNTDISAFLYVNGGLTLNTPAEITWLGSGNIGAGFSASVATTGSNTFRGNQIISQSVGLTSLSLAGSETALDFTASNSYIRPNGVLWFRNQSGATGFRETNFVIRNSQINFGADNGFYFARTDGVDGVKSEGGVEVNTISGSLVLGAVTNSVTTGSLLHLSSSSNTTLVNLVFKNNDNTADTIISGSNNLFVNPAAASAGFKRYIGGNGNIALNGSNVPQRSGSMAFSPTMNNNYFGGNSVSFNMRGPVSSNAWTISGNSFLNSVSIGTSATNNAQGIVSGLSMTANQSNASISVIANKTNLSQSLSISNNMVGGTGLTLTAASSSFDFQQNIGSIAALNSVAYSSLATATGGNSLYIATNQFAGFGNHISASGVYDTNDIQGLSFQRAVEANIIGGINNRIDLSLTPTGSNSLSATALVGLSLIITGSSKQWGIDGVGANAGGSAFFGRYNAQDGNRAQSGQTVLAVGTGNSTTRKTGFLIDSGSNTYVEGTFNVSGSTAFTGSVKVASTFQLNLPTGSNQQAGTAVLDGGNPGTVTVSNSLVTANSIILLTKQTLAHTNGYVAVSAKSGGSFTITSNHNGDTDTVGWFIINNS